MEKILEVATSPIAFIILAIIYFILFIKNIVTGEDGIKIIPCLLYTVLLGVMAYFISRSLTVPCMVATIIFAIITIISSSMMIGEYEEAFGIGTGIINTIIFILTLLHLFSAVAAVISSVIALIAYKAFVQGGDQ